jgi:DNA replication protein DnaC
MGYISSVIRNEQATRLRRNMKQFMMSSDAVDFCLNKAPAKTLDFIDDLFIRELGRRNENRKANMIKTAGFPSIKSLDDYNFSEVEMPSSITKQEMLGLDFIASKHSLVMVGVCGSGKTMLSVCLGLKACSSDYKVKFFTLAQLAIRLKAAADEGRLENTLIQLRKLDLLIIDEWGYCQIDRECAGYIFRVIADSYETKSLIITTNLPFSEWGKIVADEQLAAAIIDRIVHYGHLIDTGNKDWRLSSSPMNKTQVVELRK